MILTRAKKVLKDTVPEDSALQPDPIDSRVGSRIRLRRRLLGYSQEKLALALGLSFQQIQKYEKGLNRVGASRLYQISQILQAPINFFFDEVFKDNDIEEAFYDLSISDSLKASQEWNSPGSVNSIKKQVRAKVSEMMNSKETAELLKAYYNVKDKEIRQKFLRLVQVMGEQG